MTIDRQSQPLVTFLKLFLELQLEGLLKRMVINQKHPSSPKNAATTGSISCSVTVHISADENVFQFFYESSYVKRENHVSLFIAKILNFNILLTVQFYF